MSADAGRAAGGRPRRCCLATRWLLGVALMLGLAVSTAAQPGSGLSTIAAENAALAARVDVEAAALAQERAALARVRSAQAQLESRLQRIARHAALQATGREFAVMVRSELRALPRPELVAADAAQRQPALESASDASVRAETAALALADLDAAAARRLAAVPVPADPAQRATQAAEVRDGLAAQRELQDRLQAVTRDRLHVLRDTGQAETDLLQRSVTARSDLTRLLFWLQSPPERRLIADLGPAIDWLTAGRHWQAVATTVLDAVRSAPVFAGAALLITAILLLRRGHLHRRLTALATLAASDLSSRVGSAWKAFGLTLALALPVPLLLWAAGTLLTSAAVVHPFALAVGVSLEANARLLMALAAMAWLLDPHGLAVGHFGWDASSVRHARRAVRRFTALFVPLLVIVAINGLDHAPYANRETLARLLFAAAMVVLAVLIVRLFMRSSPLIQRLVVDDPTGWAMRLYPAWYVALLAFPLGMLGLAAAGYLTAAGYFFGRSTLTLVLLIVAGVLYGMAALWVQARQRMLSGQQDSRDRQTASSEAATAPPSQKVDLAAMGEQTRSLLDVTLTVLLIASLWWAWKDALPALSAIGDHVIWSFDATDKQAASALTVGELCLAIGIAAVTWVAVRNIGALLDSLLLKRLAFQSDANYAIKVMSRYALTGAGVLLAAGTLGISWGSAQWLIAALGVGLGFGLQEIVANFVSGLIVLAERPVRVGDLVTVGGVSGTVSAIRARSTRVIDADHKEVIIPNKALITEKVVNWTLPDKSTRLLLPVGVAHGSDIAQVQQLLLDVVHGHADIQRLPAPSVYFVGWGENSLDFEIRAHVDSLDKRLRVRHELYLAVVLALRNNGIETRKFSAS